MVSSSPLGKHAVFLGGGMAGLLTARVLTEHFERVSLIERDHYPEDPVFRPGVPQGRQFHLLLARGQQIIEELFPGIQHDLVARGAIESDLIKDHRFRTAFGWLPLFYEHSTSGSILTLFVGLVFYPTSGSANK